MEKQKRRTFVGVRIPSGLLEDLDKYADEFGQTRSDLIVEAISIFLNRMSERRPVEVSKGGLAQD